MNAHLVFLLLCNFGRNKLVTLIHQLLQALFGLK